MLQIADKTLSSRLFLGTGKFSSGQLMEEAIIASGTRLVTVALKRVNPGDDRDELLPRLRPGEVSLMPNTSGARTAREAIFAARLAREALQTNWIKLEIHPDPRYLLPDPVETLEATSALAREGFIVLPYIQADPVLCKRLEEAGAATVMPLGAPIGTNRGLRTRDMLEIIIEQSNVPVIIDAGIGAPSHAAEALEMGADAVLVNTAIAVAGDPVAMARAFKLAVEAGRIAFEARLGKQERHAGASSPLTSFLD
ncbi:MAG: thiazole synthase [Odoribacteraceae bacterium]|jgi:thiazole synthase|nr:thiazole synthase [Odoribacteraceae bacterium]